MFAGKKVQDILLTDTGTGQCSAAFLDPIAGTEGYWCASLCWSTLYKVRLMYSFSTYLVQSCSGCLVLQDMALVRAYFTS